MRGVVIVVVVVMIASAVAVSVLLRARAQKQRAVRTSPEETYRGLRGLAFGYSRSELGIPSTASPTEPWGVVMDWGIESGTATIVAVSDGSASIYTSAGGGYLGGKSHESIRKAAQNMVAVAAEFQKHTTATTDYPLPQRGEVVFYLLTDVGVFTARGSYEELSGHRHVLSKLGDAGQEIIAQYRLIQK